MGFAAGSGNGAIIAGLCPSLMAGFVGRDFIAPYPVGRDSIPPHPVDTFAAGRMPALRLCGAGFHPAAPRGYVCGRQGCLPYGIVGRDSIPPHPVDTFAAGRDACPTALWGGIPSRRTRRVGFYPAAPRGYVCGRQGCLPYGFVGRDSIPPHPVDTFAAGRDACPTVGGCRTAL